MNVNAAQDVFIRHHLNSENFNQRTIVEETASLFSILVDDYVKKTAEETFYNLPYKDISVAVFNDQSHEIKSDTFDGFITTVKDEIISAFSSYQLNISEEHVIACYEKFVSHIELALIQKKFMLNTANEANRVASNAQKQADYAKKQAKKAKDMSDGMVTNFVTILGVFATIIITVFGGINIISSTVKLLEGNNKLVYLVFVVSFLMICLLTLIKLLISWVSTMKGSQELETNMPLASNDDFKFLDWVKSIDFYTKSIVCFLMVLIASAICIACTHKNQEEGKLNETTTKQNNQNSVFFINTESVQKEEKYKINETKSPKPS